MIYTKKCMRMKWRLFQYQSPTGRRAIDDWRRRLPIGEPQASLDLFLNNMVKIDQWKVPDDLKQLKGRGAGLTELRWNVGRVPYRIIGYQSGDHEYVMLIGCTHNANKYNPPNAIETARARKEAIQKGVASRVEYQLLTSQ